MTVRKISVWKKKEHLKNMSDGFSVILYMCTLVMMENRAVIMLLEMRVLFGVFFFFFSEMSFLKKKIKKIINLIK